MKENDPFELSIRRAFAPHEPAPGLKQEVLNLKRRQTRRPVWVAYGAAGLAAAALVGVVLGLPTTSLADAAIKQAGKFQGHLIRYVILPDGRWQRTGEEWVSNGKDRSTDSAVFRTEFLHDSERGYNIAWYADSGMLKIRSLTNGGKQVWPMPQILTEQDWKDFLAQVGVHENFRTERTQFLGKPADCISLSKGGYFKSKLYSDPQTHRMLGWSYGVSRVLPGHPPENHGRIFVVDEKEPIPAHIFDPVFNIGGVPTDVIAERKRWQDRFSKPLQVFPVELVSNRRVEFMNHITKKDSVSVRSVVVNQAGDAFVLFTGVNRDFGGGVIPTVIHDSTGGRYVKGSGFSPSDDGDQTTARFSFDGKHLEGGWFVRVGGGQLKGPISVGFRQEGQPENRLAFTYTLEPERIVGDLPSYMPYLALSIGNDNAWLKHRTWALAEDRGRANDFAGQEIYIRKEIVLNANRLLGGFEPVQLLCSLADVLEKQGKRQEAYATYRKAEKALSDPNAMGGQWAKKRIAAGIARLKSRLDSPSAVPKT